MQKVTTIFTLEDIREPLQKAVKLATQVLDEAKRMEFRERCLWERVRWLLLRIIDRLDDIERR